MYLELSPVAFQCETDHRSSRPDDELSDLSGVFSLCGDVVHLENAIVDIDRPGPIRRPAVNNGFYDAAESVCLHVDTDADGGGKIEELGNLFVLKGGMFGHFRGFSSEQRVFFGQSRLIVRQTPRLVFQSHHVLFQPRHLAQLHLSRAQFRHGVRQLALYWGKSLHLTLDEIQITLRRRQFLVRHRKLFGDGRSLLSESPRLFFEIFDGSFEVLTVRVRLPKSVLQRHIAL
mmetsp:Transcript_33193/g.71704  ORF Transcript_33193/g.71704 Transcript_33193/m.71704 type:complete len:231 (+) Transcript_33193:303-995(+)